MENLDTIFFIVLVFLACVATGTVASHLSDVCTNIFYFAALWVIAYTVYLSLAVVAGYCTVGVGDILGDKIGVVIFTIIGFGALNMFSLIVATRINNKKYDVK